MSEVPAPQPVSKRRKTRRFSALAKVRAFQEQDWKRVWGGLREGFSGIVISGLLHGAALLVMAFIVYIVREPEIPPLELGWSTVVEDDKTVPAAEPIAIPTISIDSRSDSQESRPAPIEQAQELPRAKRPEPRAQDKPQLSLSDVSESLNLRKAKPGEQKSGAGTGARQGIGREAIDAGLKWLARQQQSTGNWLLTGPYPDGGSIDTRTGATALALLALLGDGQTHQSGEYAEVVQRGLDWLIKQQKPDGDLYDSLELGQEAHFYSHAQGAIALCEALALTQDENLRSPAESAVNFLIRAQNPVLGGWKYRPLTETGIGDLSVTGWVLMALHSARMADIEVPYRTFELADRFLDSVQERPEMGSLYKYRPDLPAEESQRWSMTAEGLLCRQWLGWPADAVPMRLGVKTLLSKANEPEWVARRRNLYAWYYTAQTLHNLGGSDWDRWFGHVLPLIAKHQTTAGTQKGSWHPYRPPGAFQERSQDAGRLYLTVMCLLVLETPYRHAPLYSVSH